MLLGTAWLKSSLWRAASSIVDYDVLVISTLALEKDGDASGVVSTLGTAPKGSHGKDLLLVIEGETKVSILYLYFIFLPQFKRVSLIDFLKNFDLFVYIFEQICLFCVFRSSR